MKLHELLNPWRPYWITSDFRVWVREVPQECLSVIPHDEPGSPLNAQGLPYDDHDL